MKRRPYNPTFTDDAEVHLAALTAGERATVVDAIERQLKYEPALETRNRKRMDPDKRLFVALWELRVAALRVYYAVQEEPERAVVIVAIGEKDRDRIKFGGQYIDL